MDFNLIDGTGTGRRLKVNEDNRALTDSVIHTSSQNAAGKGKLYQVGTGVLNLTSSNESAVLFIKNEEDSDLEITNFSWSADAFQGGAVDAGAMFIARLYVDAETITPGNINPNGPTNNNLGSSRELDAVYLIGQEGSAPTGGTLKGTTLLPQSDTLRFDLYWVLPKGTSLTVTIEPASGNTSVNMNAFFDLYVD